MPQFQRTTNTGYDELVRQHSRQVYNIAYTILQNRQLAEDATQEVFIRVLRYLESFRGEAKLSTWIYRVTRNCCLNLLKKERRQSEQVELPDDLPDRDTPEAFYNRSERSESVRKAVARLPLEQRSVIAFYYFQELSYREIAELMELPLNTVKSHLRRARLALADMLDCEVEHEE